ncbi:MULTISPECIES: hypothetical protein [unclassified Streptomyces]|uniref:hypothetical protein n=1 Tax=unclassified Streptomyces TaxID=2593676 RepID=UPI003819FC72
MDLRTARIQELVENHADRRRSFERIFADIRETLLRQARTASATGECDSAIKDWEKVLTVHRENEEKLKEGEVELLELMKDALVWIRSTNRDYAQIYHFSKKCGHVQRGTPKKFIPRLEGEVRHLNPCTTSQCLAAQFAWNSRPRAEAA